MHFWNKLLLKAICATGLLLLGPVTGAGAVDLDTLSGQTKRDYCAAYVFLDLEAKRQGGLITDDAYNRQVRQLVSKAVTRGGTANIAALERRVEQASQVILGENPTVGQVGAKATECRAFLKL